MSNASSYPKSLSYLSLQVNCTGFLRRSREMPDQAASPLLGKGRKASMQASARYAAGASDGTLPDSFESPVHESPLTLSMRRGQHKPFYPLYMDVCVHGQHLTGLWAHRRPSLRDSASCRHLLGGTGAQCFPGGEDGARGCSVRPSVACDRLCSRSWTVCSFTSSQF